MIGAGAVGSYYGALLARAGHDVTLVARGPHLDAMRRAGAVCVREADGTSWSVPVRARTEPEPGAPDLVVVTTKSHHTADAARVLASRIPPGTVVLSLQNGVENVGVLRSALGPGVTVLGGLAFVGLHVDPPGTVVHEAEGYVVIGDPAGGTSPAAERALAITAPAWDVTLSGEIVRRQWSKLLWNVGFNALCAVTGATAGEALATPGTRALVREAMGEAVAVAAASGVALGPEDVDGMARYNPGLRDYRPSTARDLAAGKRVERAALTGFVVRRGGEAGVPTPVNRVLDALLALQEDRATGRAAALLAELDAGAG